jgi:hypothetical protein
MSEIADIKIVWWNMPGLSPGCDCGRQPGEHHRDQCGISPIYAQTFADTGQPAWPFQWPWFAMDFPECSCVPREIDEWCPQHGPRMADYLARWQQ